MNCVVTTPAPMNDTVVTRLGSSRLESPKMPWPLVQPEPELLELMLLPRRQ